MENDQEVDRGKKEIDQLQPGNDGPGSETERFRAIVDLRHNEAVTGESGVPRHLRDHELRCQRRSLDEFS
jgi:hypothetical protein